MFIQILNNNTFWYRFICGKC